MEWTYILTGELPDPIRDFYNFCFMIALVGLVIFVSLYHINAGYGKMRTEKWGPTISNRVGWCLMEVPVFLIMLYFYALSEVRTDIPYYVFFIFFEIHYLQRSFIFPFLIKGESQMPIVIMALSMLWNVLNGYIQGFWFFYLAPRYGMYSAHWIHSWQFILGATLFFAGMLINIHSDYVIRHLRKPGDTKHYLGKGCTALLPVPITWARLLNGAAGRYSLGHGQEPCSSGSPAATSSRELTLSTISTRKSSPMNSTAKNSNVYSRLSIDLVLWTRFLLPTG